MIVLHTGPFGVNTLIVPLTDSKAFIVDPASCSFCGDESAVTDCLTQNNLEPVAIILTHGHFDHVSGLKYLLQKYPSIPVLINKNDESMIGQDSAVTQGKSLKKMGFYDFIESVSNLPSCTSYLEDGDSLADCIKDVKDDVLDPLKKWVVIHTPGHTRGSCCLYNEKDKLLISGDTLFYHSWGRCDLDGGSETEMFKSLKKLSLKCNPDTLVYPGHEHFGFMLKENF